MSEIEKSGVENSQIELDKFRNDFGNMMEERKQNNTAQKGEREEFDPAVLTAEDMEIWNKIKDGSLTAEEFEPYRSMVSGFINANQGTKAAFSRTVFCAFAGNELLKLNLKREREEYEKNER